MRPARLLALRLAIGVAIGLALGAPIRPALGAELPPEIAALVTGDEGARAAAVGALAEHPERNSLVAGVLRDPDAVEALDAGALVALARMVAEHEIPFANGGLRRLVRDRDADIAARRAAAEALGKTGSVADVSALGDALLDIPDAAARALVAIDGTAAANALRRGAGEDPPPVVRAALARMGDETYLQSLVAALASESAERRQEVAGLLAWATGRELPAERAAWDAYMRRRQLATQLALEDNDVAQTAVQELSAVLASRTSATLGPDLEAILLDDRWHVFARDKAALVLGLGGRTEAVPALLRACRNQEDGSVRLYSAEALARVGDLRVAVPFARMLVHDEDRDRIKARRGQQGEYFPVDPAFVRTLRRLGVPGGVEALIGLFEGEYRTRMHRDVLRAFREASGGEDFGFEADDSKPRRLAAAKRIREWWRDARETLGPPPRADDPGWDEFRAAVDERIGQLGAFKFLHQLRAKNALIIVAEPALPQLVAALDHEDLHTRMGAAEVLRGAALRRAAPALAARLEKETNPAAMTRFLWALEVCGRRGPDGEPPAETVREAVRRKLDHRVIDVKVGAVRTLGVVGDPDTDVERVRAMRGQLPDVDAFTTATSGALLLLGDRSGISELLRELRSDDVARRAHAVDLLEAAGVDLHGYDPDAPAAGREDAVVQIESDSVSHGERR